MLAEPHDLQPSTHSVPLRGWPRTSAMPCARHSQQRQLLPARRRFQLPARLQPGAALHAWPRARTTGIHFSRLFAASLRTLRASLALSLVRLQFPAAAARATARYLATRVPSAAKAELQSAIVANRFRARVVTLSRAVQPRPPNRPRRWVPSGASCGAKLWREVVSRAPRCPQSVPARPVAPGSQRKSRNAPPIESSLRPIVSAHSRPRLSRAPRNRAAAAGGRD